MQGIYNYMPATNHVSMVQTYNHADILWLQFMMDRKLNVISQEKHFALNICTFRSTLSVRNTAVFVGLSIIITIIIIIIITAVLKI
jgi:hypothetical protein